MTYTTSKQLWFAICDGDYKKINHLHNLGVRLSNYYTYHINGVLGYNLKKENYKTALYLIKTYKCDASCGVFELPNYHGVFELYDNIAKYENYKLLDIVLQCVVGRRDVEKIIEYSVKWGKINMLKYLDAIPSNEIELLNKNNRYFRPRDYKNLLQIATKYYHLDCFDYTFQKVNNKNDISKELLTDIAHILIEKSRYCDPVILYYIIEKGCYNLCKEDIKKLLLIHCYNFKVLNKIFSLIPNKLKEQLVNIVCSIPYDLVEVTKLLVERGCPINNSCIMTAKYNKNTEIHKYLVNQI